MTELADPTALQDPNEAFLEGGVLAPPVPVTQEHISRELGAAVVAIVMLMRRHLANQKPELGQTPKQVRSAWDRLAPIWLKLAVPAVKKAYAMSAEDLSEDELHALASDYANEMGSYLSDTSGEALADAMAAQVDRGWNPELAWQRGTAVFGLDQRDMRGFVAGLLHNRDQVVYETELVPSAARAKADSAFLARAERLAEQESYSAIQSGKAIAWIWLERMGRIPAGSRRKWVIGDTESHCATCAELGGQAVPVSEPFVLVSGGKVWAPRAHPNCDCRVELLRPPELISKADDEPRDSRGRWAKVAERTTEDFVIPKEPASPFGPAPASPFGAASPFSGSATSFGSPFQAPPSPFGSPFAPESPFSNEAKSPFTQTKRPNNLSRRVIVLPPLPRRRPLGTYYLPVDNFHTLVGDASMGAQYDRHEEVDFDQGAAHPQAQAGESPWNMLDDSYVLSPTRVGDLSEDEVGTLWGQILPKAYMGFNVAMNEADDILDNVDVNDLKRIEKLAGLDWDGDPKVARWRIKRAVSQFMDAQLDGEETDVHDDSLAMAFGDFVTWAKPEKYLGTFGASLAGVMDEAENKGLKVREWAGDHPHPVEQVFAFGHGLHPGTPHDEQVARMQGPYVADYHTYRSALHDLRDREHPPLRIGLRETYMQPFVEGASPPPSNW